VSPRARPEARVALLAVEVVSGILGSPIRFCPSMDIVPVHLQNLSVKVYTIPFAKKNCNCINNNDLN
jgi:hypothetical protein